MRVQIQLNITVDKTLGCLGCCSSAAGPGFSVLQSSVSLLKHGSTKAVLKGKGWGRHPAGKDMCPEARHAGKTGMLLFCGSEKLTCCASLSQMHQSPRQNLLQLFISPSSPTPVGNLVHQLTPLALETFSFCPAALISRQRGISLCLCVNNAQRIF